MTPESPDRAIAWAIWSRGEAAALTSEEAWAILHERYPDDPRFLLLNAYAELRERKKLPEGPKAEAGVLSAAYFLKKVERVLGAATDALHPPLRDLVVFGFALLAGAKGEERAAVVALRARLHAEGGDPKRDERDRAALRLRRFEREVVKELHDRTEGGKPLGVRAPPPAPSPPASDWAAATADAGKPRHTYAATERFERGELVEHPKFGVGVVTGIEPGKVVVLFESGFRKLVAGA